MQLIYLLLWIAAILPIQQKDSADEIVLLTNQIAASTKSQFTFDLESVPTTIQRRITATHDSLSWALYREKEKTHWKKFLARPYDDWNATDAIQNEKLPFRRFLYAVSSGTKWIITYEHGGFGTHLHVIYFDSNNAKTITTFVTLQNSAKIHELTFNKRLTEIKDHPFENIVNRRSLKLLSGQLVTPLDSYDLF